MKKLFSILVIGFSMLACFAQQDINIATGSFEGEPYLAINPSNPQNIVIAWMHVSLASRPIRTRASFDGGQTWMAPVDLPIIHSQTADPTMAFDRSGNLYICLIDHLGSSSNNVGGVYSYKSTDGGQTWGSPALAIDLYADGQQLPVDRPWLVCDRSGGQYDGYLYLTTKMVNGSPAPYHPYFLRSIDGAQTWSNWKFVDSTGWLSSIPNTFAAPTVSADGKFCGMYPSYVATQHPIPRYLLAYSNDGGASFNYKAGLSSMPTVSNDSAKKGWQFIADQGDQNHLAFFFTAGVNGDMDIMMTETYDFGNTWSSMTRVNDDPIGNGVLQDMIWASFDEDSDLAVCWRDRRNDGGSGYARASEIFGTVRWKDSLNFSPNFIISDTLTPYNNILSQAGNDFLCQQLQQDTLYVTWGDTRTGFLNIWFEKIALNTGNSTGLINLNHSEIPLLEIYPNPSNDFVILNTKDQELISIKIFSLDGKMLQIEKQNRFSVKGLPNGSYFIVTETESGRFTNKLIKN